MRFVLTSRRRYVYRLLEGSGGGSAGNLRSKLEPAETLLFTVRETVLSDYPRSETELADGFSFGALRPLSR